jgi:5-methylcytosine-specific restriction endonuclease McrA
MKQLTRDFFEQGRRLDADPATRAEASCWICLQRIDYDAAPGTTEDSHELDHYFPVSTHPDLQEDPTNFRHSHRRCNGERSNQAPKAGLGEQVPDWW